MRTLRMILAFVASLGLLAGTGTAAPVESIRFGLLSNVTGPVATLGIPVRQGAELGVDAINAGGGIDGRPVTLIFEDSGESNTTTISATQRILSRQPVVLLGLPLSTQAFAALPTILDAQIPLFVFGTHPTLAEQSPWVFSVLPHAGILARGATDFAVNELGRKNIAVIHTDDEFGTAAGKVIVDRLAALGLKPATVQSMPSAERDATAQLLAVRRSGADAMIVWTLQPNMITIYRQRKQLGVNIPVVGALILPGTMRELAPEEVEGIHLGIGANLAGQLSPGLAKFGADYQARFRSDPDEYAAAAFDVVHLAAQAVKSQGADPAKIRGYVSAMRAFNGILGAYQADRVGNLARRAVIVRIQNKKFVTVKELDLR